MRVKSVDQVNGANPAAALSAELTYTGTDLPQLVPLLEPETIPQTMTTISITVPTNPLIQVTPVLVMERTIVVGVAMQIIPRMDQVVSPILEPTLVVVYPLTPTGTQSVPILKLGTVVLGHQLTVPPVTMSLLIQIVVDLLALQTIVGMDRVVFYLLQLLI
jgi:hypothetical protein